MSGYDDQAHKLSGSTGFTPAEVADYLARLIVAGHSDTAAVELIETADRDKIEAAIAGATKTPARTAAKKAGK